MGRIVHQKSAKQSAISNSVRGPKVAKQRKNHKVVIESDSKDKEQSRAVLSFRADPPPGYTFIPAGNPQLTSALKEFAKKGNHQIFAVTTTPHASRHELSREVHRIGFHFPTEVVSQVCNHYGIRLTSGGKLVEEKDDDKLFMRLYQKGQLVLDEKVRDQVTINTEAKQIIQDLFPNIPDKDLFQIIKTAFQLGDGKVGTADEIPLVRRAQLSVVAHIRHTYTTYDKLLRTVPYSEARHRVENITLQKLIDWRGDTKGDKQAMDDTLREVVVISDEEDSDEVEEGQLLENNDLRVQPIRGPVLPKTSDGRPQSPIEIYSDDEAPRGYRYVPQVVRRYQVQDPLTVYAARQQSRYAVWDRARQEYQTGVVSQPARVVERFLIDEPSVVPSPTSYVTREPLYPSEPLPRRVQEPAARVVSQPSPPTYVRGADGKLYEKITTYTQPVIASAPLRRVHTPPPSDYGRQHLGSRQASPRPQPPRLHGRTESFENHDGSVLPSIEGSSNLYASPTTRRNPFEDSWQISNHRNSGAFGSNQGRLPLIDLTDSAEKASKRRRLEGTPPSPYLIRQADRGQNGYDRNGVNGDVPYPNDKNTRPMEQSLIPKENPAVSYQPQATYERTEPRMQPTVVYRTELSHQNLPSPRNNMVRQLPLNDAGNVAFTQPSRRIEYVNDYDRPVPRSYRELNTQQLPSPTTAGIDDRATRVALEDLSFHGRPSSLRAGPTRYVRSNDPNNLDTSTQPQYYVPGLHHDPDQREYVRMAAPEHAPSRDVRMTHIQANDGRYQQVPLPTTVYRDGPTLRTTYIQN